MCAIRPDPQAIHVAVPTGHFAGRARGAFVNRPNAAPVTAPGAGKDPLIGEPGPPSRLVFKAGAGRTFGASQDTCSG